VKFAFIDAHRGPVWTVVLMCEVLEVSRAGYYRWRTRKPTPRQSANERLLAWMLSRAKALHGIPGYRKLWQEATIAGFASSPNRVQRLLQSVGYRSCVAPRPGYRKPEPGMPVLPNLLNRAFAVAEPNRVWASDITQVRCHEGWLYLAVVLDLHARQIVGWAAGPVNDAELVLRALNHAWQRRRPEGEQLLFHSDQGAQYRSEAVMSWLTGRGVTLSMSRRANCWDNACAESFFSLLKKEWLSRLSGASREEMQGEIAYYVDEFYPWHRRHGNNGGVAPAIFEQLAAA
jgi:putative transposase